ncbi:MAG: OmpA family protein, partial [Saprospiraceae bacterium]
IIGFTNDATVMVYYKGYDKKSDGSVYTDTLSNEEKAYYPTKFSSPYRVNEGDRSPFFFNDSILIFAANKPEGFGGLDLYVTMRIQKNYWTRPENLGPQVNSAYDEQYPFLCMDGRTLYFSSNGKKSMGGFDIFKATFNNRVRAWTEAKNVGLPFNSPADDISFRMSSDGLKSYFSSNRLGAVGGFDIFTGYFKTVQENQIKPSKPVAFNLVGAEESETGVAENTGNTNTNTTEPIKDESVYTEPIIKEDIRVGAIYYNDDNVLTTQNKNELNKFIRILKGKGLAKVEIIGHADENDPEKFRTYFTYLRAEKAGDYLKRNGISNNQVIVKGVGSNYPVAYNFLERNTPNEVGQKMNRRIEFRILNESNTDFNITYIEPNVDASIK